MKKRNASIGEDILNQILDNCPDINPTWLLTGKGDMLVTEERHEVQKEVIQEMRPHIPLYAAAGALAFVSDAVRLEDCEVLPYIEALGKYNFTIQASGDSMIPEYHSGDTLACLRIEDNAFIQWGRTYVLDTTQGIIVKRIFDDDDSIRCESINTQYPSFSIPKSEILGLALAQLSLSQTHFPSQRRAGRLFGWRL
ncbi:MAG: helix-turn-helix transcriptional regulator [Bacteroidales bacterium]